MTMVAGRVQENLARIRDRVDDAARKSGRTESEIHLVAVTKTVSVEHIEAARSAGVRDFGENRIQEAQVKIETIVCDDVRWHFIGHLQSNKARVAVGLFDLIQSVDTLKLAQTLDRIAAERPTGLRCPVLLEVNTSGEASKFGFTPSELLAATDELARISHLDIQGLMTIGPLHADEAGARRAFASLRELRDRVRAACPHWSLDTLSMGMSDDFEVAISEGATLIRLGRAIFGERAS